MVGVTPQTSVNPYVARRHAEQQALTEGGLRNMQAGTAAYGAAQIEQMKSQADIAKTMLSNADDLSSVFGGMQTGTGLQNYLNLPSLIGLQETGYTGDMTGKIDGMRLADMAAGIAAKSRSGRGGGGGSGGKNPFNGMINISWTDPVTEQRHTMPMKTTDASRLLDADNESFRDKYDVQIGSPAGNWGSSAGGNPLASIAEEELKAIADQNG